MALHWMLAWSLCQFQRIWTCIARKPYILWFFRPCPASWSQGAGAGGGGGTLIFSHIRRLGPFFWGSKFWISIFFWVLRKMNIFGGYEDFVDIILGSSQNWASLRVISVHLGPFLRSRYRIGIFFGLLKFQTFFWGAWNSWYFFWVNGRCWVRAYVYGKNWVPPPPTLGSWSAHAITLYSLNFHIFYWIWSFAKGNISSYPRHGNIRNTW